MQTILRILKQAGGWHHGLYLKIENTLPRRGRVDHRSHRLSRECVKHPQGSSEHLQGGYRRHRPESQSRVCSEGQGKEAAATRQGCSEGQESRLTLLKEAANLRPRFIPRFSRGRERPLRFLPAPLSRCRPRSPVRAAGVEFLLLHLPLLFLAIANIHEATLRLCARELVA